MGKSYTLQNDTVTGQEKIKTSQIEMLREAIAEIERGTVSEIVLVKNVANDLGKHMTVLSRAVRPNSFVCLIGESIDRILRGEYADGDR